jgi:hypothetical protein
MLVPGFIYRLIVQAACFAVAYGIIMRLGSGRGVWQALVVGGAYAFTALSHEGGHYLAAWQFGANPSWASERISVYNYPQTLTHQRLISLAGPICGFATGLSLLFVYLPLAGPFTSIMLACIALAHLLNLAPFFQDGSLLFMTRKEFYHVQDH